MESKGVVPGFKYDLFISYAHANNQYGWVSEFQEDLSNLLWEQLPAKPTIWWDARGLDGQAIHAGIKDAVYESAVFVPVVSNAYLNSGYCVPFELEPFKNFQHSVFPLMFGTFKRIVVAGYDTESDCPRDTWPEVLRDAPFASFCDTTPAGDRQLHGRLPVRNPQDEYWVRLGRAVRHLRAVLGEMRKGPQGDAVAELPVPTAPTPKAPAAWRARWKNAAVHLRYHGVDANAAMDVVDRVASKQCDVTYLGNEGDDNLNEVYLKNSDAEILFFGCDVMDWARMDVLRTRSLASDQGRPKRLGVLSNGQCPQRFGMVSDFIVPLQLTDGGEIEGLDRLLEGLK